MNAAPVRLHPILEHEALLDEGTPLVDVREPDEFASGTLPGAINVPVGQLADRLDEFDRSARIVLFCRSGARSARAAEFLASCGFVEVVDLDGGMLQWSAHR